MDLNQLTVPVTDMSQSVAFYSSLGLRLIVNSAPRYVRFECPDGKSTFSLHQYEIVTPAAGLVIYFECTDLDDKVAELEKSGISFISRPADQPWLWREARLADPDGHQLCLFHAGRNRRDPPWRV